MLWNESPFWHLRSNYLKTFLIATENLQFAKWIWIEIEFGVILHVLSAKAVVWALVGYEIRFFHLFVWNSVLLCSWQNAAVASIFIKIRHHSARWFKIPRIWHGKASSTSPRKLNFYLVQTTRKMKCQRRLARFRRIFIPLHLAQTLALIWPV